MDAPTKDLSESNPSTTKRSSSSSSTSELVDQATLKRLEKFEKLKLERRKEVDAEADLFLDELKQRGISKEKFKQMLPKDMELDEIKERAKKPWILTILNYLLCRADAFVVYIFTDLSISIPGVIKRTFPGKQKSLNKYSRVWQQLQETLLVWISFFCTDRIVRVIFYFLNLCRIPLYPILHFDFSTHICTQKKQAIL